MPAQALPNRQRTIADRRFYLIVALAAVAIIVTGFSRSYYLRSFLPQSAPLSLLVHIHGLVFTAWVLYFIAQTALVAVNRIALHRRLGLLGAFLGSAVIILGLVVAFTAMRLGHGSPVQSAEVIFLIGLVDISSFALFFILGYLRRKDREAHQRLMLFSVVVGLTGPALGRILLLGVPIPVLSLLNFALLLAGPIYDIVTRRTIHPVYRWGVAYAVVTFTPFRFIVGNTPWWHHTAHLLAGIK